MAIVTLFRGLTSLAWLSFIIVWGIVGHAGGKKTTYQGHYDLMVGVLAFCYCYLCSQCGDSFIEPNQRGVVVSPYSFRGPKGIYPDALIPRTALDCSLERQWSDIQSPGQTLHHVGQQPGR